MAVTAFVLWQNIIASLIYFRSSKEKCIFRYQRIVKAKDLAFFSISPCTCLFIFRFFENLSREIFCMGKIPKGIFHFPRGKKFPCRNLQIPTRILTFVIEYFCHYNVKPKSYIITPSMVFLLEISHFSCLCQLKVLGLFANKLVSNWQKGRVAVFSYFINQV